MPGKLKFGVMKALLEVSRGGSCRRAEGRVGLMLEALVMATELIWPVTGVHGKPVWALMMALSCHPPTTLPIQSVRVRKMGRSQSALAVKECFASKSEGPCSFCSDSRSRTENRDQIGGVDEYSKNCNWN